MEEDAGKNTHIGGSTGRIHGAEYSLLDYNRAGIPLVEIVTKPIEGAGSRAPAVARAYVQTLRDLVRALGVSDVRMERGNVRARRQRPIRPTPEPSRSAPARRRRTSTRSGRSSAPSATRSARQAAVLAGVADHPGDAPLARGHRGDHVRPREVGRRGLPVLPRARPGADRARPEWVEATAYAGCPRPPPAACRGCSSRWGYSDAEMRDVVGAGAVELIEPTVAAGASPAAAQEVVDGRAGSHAPSSRTSSSRPSRSRPPQIGQLQKLVDDGAINDKLARQVLEGVLAGEGDPADVVAARGLDVVSDESALSDAVDAAIAGATRRRRPRSADGKVAAGRGTDRCGDEGDARASRRWACSRTHPCQARLASWGVQAAERVRRGTGEEQLVSVARCAGDRGDSVVPSNRSRWSRRTPSAA